MVFQILYDLLFVGRFLVPRLNACKHLDNKASYSPNVGFLEMLIKKNILWCRVNRVLKYGSFIQFKVLFKIVVVSHDDILFVFSKENIRRLEITEDAAILSKVLYCAKNLISKLRGDDFIK